MGPKAPPTPAVLNMQSRPPKRPTARSTRLSTSRSTETSPRNAARRSAAPRSPASDTVSAVLASFMSPITTRAPSARKRRVLARPIPLPPPVMTATFPSSRPLMACRPPPGAAPRCSRSTRRRARPASAARRPALGGIAGDGPHVGGHAHFKDLEGIRGGDLVVAQPAGNVEGLSRLQPDGLSVLEDEVDPPLQRVDELGVADVVVPSRRFAHAPGGGHHLGAHPAAARGGDPEVAILEEVPPAGHQRSGGGIGVGELSRGDEGGGSRAGGRRVVHLAPPRGQNVASRNLPDRRGPGASIAGSLRGRSIVVDLKTEEGEEIARRLMRAADIIAENLGLWFRRSPRRLRQARELVDPHAEQAGGNEQEVA